MMIAMTSTDDNGDKEDRRKDRLDISDIPSEEHPGLEASKPIVSHNFVRNV